MVNFLSSNLFRFLLFPLTSALLGVMVKYVTRNDKYAKFTKEDFAIGLELVLTAGLMFVLLTSDWAVSLISANTTLHGLVNVPQPNIGEVSRLQAHVAVLSEKVATAGWVVFAFVAGLWGISTIVRKWGWVSETELSTGVGIAIPLVVGILALVFVMAEAQ